MTVEVTKNSDTGLLELIINRPAQKNALNLSMYESLASAFEAAAEDGELRLVLIRGYGGAFTSGNDLADFASANEPLDEDHALPRFMKALATCPIPVVAVVEGVAVGIGTTMLLHCDLVYVHPNATFSLPFVNLGLCPEYASSYLLPRLAGHVQAFELLMLGEKFSAQKALEIGLVNEVLDTPLERAQEQSEKLLQKAPEAIRISKQLLKEPLLETTFKVMQKEADLFKLRLQSAEFAEAVSAFFEKRPADFSRLSGTKSSGTNPSEGI